MGWTLDELWALPIEYYDALFEMVKERYESGDGAPPGMDEQGFE